MEFSEYLQLDRMVHWPRFLRHPVRNERNFNSNNITFNPNFYSTISFQNGISLSQADYHAKFLWISLENWFKDRDTAATNKLNFSNNVD